MNTRRHIITAAAAIAVIGLTAPLSAQETLQGEVTVERSIEPVERDATPLALLPRVELPRVTSPQLDYSRLGVRSRVIPTAGFAEPAMRPLPMLAQADRRGYVSLEAGAPLIDASLSAGYRAVATEKTRLNLWLQYDTENYRRATPGVDDSESRYWRDHDIAAGAWLLQDLGNKGHLNVSASYHFAHTNGYLNGAGYWVNTNDARLSALWSRRREGWSLEGGLDYGYFGYNSIGIPQMKGARQSDIRLRGMGELAFGDISWGGVEINLEILHTGDHLTPDYLLDSWKPEGATTPGVLTITPYYRLRHGSFSLSAGPRLDISFKAGKAIHVAPRVDIGWTPVTWFALDLSAGGGEHVNTLSSLAEVARRTVPGLAYGFSHIPLTVDASALFGSKHALWGRIFGGWARANSWLMPALPAPAMTAIQFSPTDIKGFHGGVEAGWSWRGLASITASWEAAQSGRGKGYYLWHDRARHVVSVDLNVRPIKPLSVDVSWRLRAQRSIVTPVWFETPEGVTADEYSVNLRNSSDLSARAVWTFSHALDVSLSATNILGRGCYQLDTTPMRSVAILAGATYKF